MKSTHIAPLERELTRVAQLAVLPEDQLRVRNDRISHWSVSQQLDHILKVCIAMMTVVLKPGRQPPRPINLIGRAILLSGWIPRGRAKAPERVHGVEVTSEQLAGALADARRLLDAISADDFDAGSAPLVIHPFFGGLTAAQTLRTLVVHTRHHLRIVDDIRRQDQSPTPS